MSGADRKWIDLLVNTITESWDTSTILNHHILILGDKSRPRTMSFVGSEDYIRAQFEEYILALLSSVKYDNYLKKHSLPSQESILPEIGSFAPFSLVDDRRRPRSRLWGCMGRRMASYVKLRDMDVPYRSRIIRYNRT
jgi:hypothetical protein